MDRVLAFRFFVDRGGQFEGARRRAFSAPQHGGRSEAERLRNNEAQAELAGRLSRFEIDEKTPANAGRERQLILRHIKGFSPRSGHEPEFPSDLRGTLAKKSGVFVHAMFPSGNMRGLGWEIGRQCSRAGTLWVRIG
jgi:hypothetical protein